MSEGGTRQPKFRKTPVARISFALEQRQATYEETTPLPFPWTCTISSMGSAA